MLSSAKLTVPIPLLGELDLVTSLFLAASGLTGRHGHVRFYSDHVTDAPVFEWSDEPVAV